MCPASLVSTSGVVGEVLARRHAVRAQVGENRVEPASRSAVAVVATEGDDATRSKPDPRSIVRNVLSTFLEFNEPVNDLVNQYIELFDEEPDRMSPWRLRHVVGQITNTITSLDGSIATMLRATEEAQVGPAESDRNIVDQNCSDLGKVQRALAELTALTDDAQGMASSPESCQKSFERLRSIMDDAWRATTMLFKIASKLVTRVLDQMTQWTVSSEAISGAVSTSTRDSRYTDYTVDSSAQVTLNK
jgi:hypothetical protein